MTQETVDHEHQQDDHTDSFFFHDSNDRLLSSSSSCSTSTSDDDTPTPQNDTLTHATLQNDTVTHRNDASINALPQFPFPTMCKYDAWISEPSSLSERRSRLLRQFGLPAPPPSSAAIPRSASSHHCTDTSSTAAATATIPRSKSDNTADRGTKHCKSSVVPIHDNDDGFLVNNSKNRGGGTGGSVCVNNNRICVSVYEDDDEGGGGIGEGNVNVNVDVSNVVDEDVQACTIRDLDNGKEFVVKEDGVWNEVKEVGTGRRLTVEEFEMTVGHSPIVQELMRRQNVEEVGNGEGVDGGGGGGGDDDDDDEGDGGKVKRKGGWFKFMSLKSVVVGQKERRRGDEKDTSLLEKGGGRRSSSATDDSQDGGGLVHGGERVRVRQYGKSFKEVTGLYRSPEIQAHEGSIWCIKFSLDGKYLASAGEDCVIHVWQVVESERKGELLVEKPEDGNLNIMFLVNGSPEPSSPGMDNNSEKKRRGRLSVSRKSLSLDQLVVPETVFALTDKPVCSFKGHLHDVLDLSWSKSQRLLSSSMDKTVRLWHLSSKSCLKVFSHSDYVTCIQFNPVDDRYFISGSLDAKVRIWSIPDRQVVDWADLHEMVTAACYTPDGQGALVGTYKGRCHLYNTSGTIKNKLQQKSQINLQNRKKRSNHKKITGFQVVNGLTAGLLDIRTYEGQKWKKKFVPGSSSEVLITSSDSRIRLVDGIELVHKFKGFRNANSQISACLTANGKYVVSASEDSHVYIWKNEADCRPNRSKGVTVTSTYENFHCKDVSVAIPWPGMDVTSEMHDSYFAKEPEHDGDGDEDEVSSANHPPTPVEENLGSEGSQFASGCNNSPLHGTIASATDSYFLDRISATWAEEKLLTTRDRSPRVSVDLSNGVNQNMSAWGMVIVTAGLQGEIKIFQNFGLPLGI